jgi:hypothetical protein
MKTTNNDQKKIILRRISFGFLCLIPFLDFIVVGMRGLRIPGVYQAVGAALFLAIIISASLLDAKLITSGSERERRIALAGALLLTPWTVISLMWVGLATPWDATPPENQMRYAVLLIGAIAVTIAFVILKEALNDLGERFYSTLGFATNMLAGAAYLIWLSFQLGLYTAKVTNNQVPPEIAFLGNVFDTLLFVASSLTYLATAALAASLGQIGWLRRRASIVYVIINFIALLFLILRGLSFPDPTVLETPWYMNVGFTVGIPAVPWIMPFLLGVGMLKKKME